jgi:hypothetical protein
MELILGGRATVTLPPPSRPAEFVAAWRDLEAAGLRVRPRALATTLFARLCLADGFLHGIGGGKYDELTDAIAVRHFGVRPAAYAVLSATLRLPLPCPAVTPDDRQRLARLARDVAWNPWRHLPADAPPEALALVDRRQSVVAESPPTRRGRRQRYRELLSLTEALRPFASAAAEGAAQALAETDADLAVRAVLRRRDFSFVLFPEALLRPFLTSVE